MSRLNTWTVWITASLLVGLTWSCEDGDDDLQQRVDQMILVEGYVYAGEPIRHVRVARLHSEGSAHSIPVSDAQVAVAQGQTVFSLVPIDSMPGSYVQEDTLVLPSHSAEGLQLTIQHGDRTYQAYTSMPPMITGLSIDQDVLQFTASQEDDVLATLSWDPLTQGPYCIFIRNIDDAAIETGNNYTDAGNNPFISLVHTHQVALKAAHFSHLGTYDLYVTAANPEYANLYAGNPGGNFVSAPSNISNGYGVFTAFNGASVTVHVQ